MRNQLQPSPGEGVVLSPDELLSYHVDTNPRVYIRTGWWIVIAGVGGFLLWASLAPLDKGVPLSGTVTVSTSRKAIQHPTGGIVDAILV